MTGLFINNKKAKDSIYESGYMVYQCLLLSEKYRLDYVEVDINDRLIPQGYDFYFFNYHPLTMGWLKTKTLGKDLGFCFAMVLEVAPNDPFVYCPSRDFDGYCVLDPTVQLKNKKVYPFPRPLEKIDFTIPENENEVPVIGSFGFATKGKGFQHVIDAVNKEFEKAIVRINIPYGDFVPDSMAYAQFLGDLCKEKAKPGIEVIVTHEFMNKKDLILWCAANSLNCFLYDRNMPGLAATTDQAIASGKPLSVSENDTFRHIIQYLPPYPAISLKESLVQSVASVKKMQHDWSPENFALRFEKVIESNRPFLRRKITDTSVEYQLPVKEPSLVDFIEHRFKKYKRKIKNFHPGILLGYNDSKHQKKVI